MFCFRLIGEFASQLKYGYRLVPLRIELVYIVSILELYYVDLCREPLLQC
jgi:hypothetical protein